MRFLIITHVAHKKAGQKFFAYTPYVREMNLWFKHVDAVELVAPLTTQLKGDIDLAYQHKNIKFTSIPSIQFTTFKTIITSIFKMPRLLFLIFKACKRADHIHLRCPGNIGLLGCIVQIAFPSKPKTVKYAGNWDPKSEQPFSYRIQKWILSNTFLSKNIKVLVYGHWPNQSKNIIPFFTATYLKEKTQEKGVKIFKDRYRFLFVGVLSLGKRPLYAIKLVEKLIENKHDAYLDIFGDGLLKTELEDYINKNNLKSHIKIHGNKSSEKIEQAYKESHFLILASNSEGWPKAIAEAMFWGCIPLATSVSCVPYMLDYGKRGMLISTNLEEDYRMYNDFIKSKKYKETSDLAQQWSRQYTLDDFENEIEKILHP